MSTDADQGWKSLLLIVAALALLVGASIGAVVLFSGSGRRSPSDLVWPIVGAIFCKTLACVNRQHHQRLDSSEPARNCGRTR